MSIILYYVYLYEKPFPCNVINPDRTEKLPKAKVGLGFAVSTVSARTEKLVQST
jgi:hypothetical protein